MIDPHLLPDEPIAVAIEPHKRRNQLLAVIAPVLVILLFLLLWEVWVRATDKPAWYLPPPSLVAQTAWEERSLLLSDSWVTLQEVLLGFGVALVAGITTATVFHFSRLMERTFYPLVIASQAIPVVALAPLLLIWFGHGILPKVIMVALISFFPIAVATTDGLRSADRETLELLQTMGASSWQQFRYVSAPTALPSLFSGARVGIAVAVIGAVIGEFVGSDSGLGHAIILANASLRTDLVFACVAVLAVMAVMLFGGVSLAERILLPWRRFSSDHAR